MNTFTRLERAVKLVPHPYWLCWYLLILLGNGSAILAGNDASAKLPGAHLS